MNHVIYVEIKGGGGVEGRAKREGGGEVGPFLKAPVPAITLKFY